MNQLVPLSKPASNPFAPDPRIDQTLHKAGEFLRDYAAPSVATSAKDILDGQYKIEISTPLPQFNMTYAKAFAATNLMDGKELMALVCEPNTIQRHSVLDRLLMLRNPNFCSVFAAGTVELSQPAEERFVIFCDSIKGQKLSALLNNGKARVPINIMIDNIIKPLTSAIVALQDMGITHGSINPEYIYFDKVAILAPCITEPCGFSQPYYYELAERIEAHPAGKGDFHDGADFYAMAVLVLQILFGPQFLQRNNQQSLARSLLRIGPFMALTGGREVPEDFFDFLWGMLGSGTNTRWNYRYLKPWLDGKHYNIIPAPPPTEGSKPYECFGSNAHSRREIAHLIRQNWDKTQETLKAASLPQWIIMMLRQKELSELVGRHVKTIVESNMKNEVQRNEHLMRLVLMLDNAGPLSYVKIAFHLDGLPSLIAYLYLNRLDDEIALITKFIEQNLMLAWADLQMVKEVEIPEHISQLLTKLDRVRGMLRNTGLGFGISRIVYDLNPQMPCLSPLCRGRHITTLAALLKHLDKIAPGMAATQDPIDEHIAAFIASKLVITNEIKLYDLNAIPAIANNNALLALKLFAVAQHRSGNMDLSGLTHWIVQRAVPLLQNLKSDTLRGKTLQMVIDQAMEGRTQRLGDLLLDGEIVNADQTGYQKALANYRRNADQIERYKRQVNVEHDSMTLGSIIAKIFAYMALLFSIYNIFMAYE